MFQHIQLRRFYWFDDNREGLLRQKSRPSSDSPGDGQGMVGKDSSQGSEHGMTLFAHRGKIAAHTTKGGYPHFEAYGSRNLLLNGCPAQIPLRLIVGKRQVFPYYSCT